MHTSLILMTFVMTAIAGAAPSVINYFTWARIRSYNTISRTFKKKIQHQNLVGAVVVSLAASAVAAKLWYDLLLLSGEAAWVLISFIAVLGIAQAWNMLHNLPDITA